MKVERIFHRGRGKNSEVEIRTGESPDVPTKLIPRVSRLMALAIRFDELLKSGQIKSQTEMADLGHVSRARVSQIMRLLDLAPDIQEAILFLSQIGTRSISERELRGIARLAAIPRGSEKAPRTEPSS